MPRSAVRNALVLVASTICIVSPGFASSAAKPPNLRGEHAYSGTIDLGAFGGGMGFEVEKQKGRKLVKVVIDAANQSQLHGGGKISKDLLTFVVNTHTDGPKKSRNHLHLEGSVQDGGQILDGTCELTRPGLETLTGTFSVHR